MRRGIRLAVTAVFVSGLLAGCGQARGGGAGGGGMAGGTAASAPAAGASGAALRASLNALLQEHVYLAAAATGAALDGREGEFKAAAAALDDNSQAIAGAIGSVYGAPAEQAFLPLWRRHIGFAVDYTVGLARRDQAQQEAAVASLLGYTDELAGFLATANPHLPRAAVADLVKHHVLTLKAVIDAQATRDPVRAYTALRTAAGHMQMIADPLATAIARQFPDRFRG